jgi:hypothetical protein
MIADNFLLCSYQKILETALKSNYEFIGFDQIGHESSPYSCLLRHDVDSELWNCQPMAKIESELGISATYFIMLRSTSYNLFCLESRNTIEKLLKYEHCIGLHLMWEMYEKYDFERIEEKILVEVDTVQNEFGVTIEAISFHHPSQYVLKNDIFINSLVNTYNRIQLGNYFYVSDSNMIWQHEHPNEIFSNHIYPRLHLLIHPMWWTTKPMSPKNKWLHVLDGNREVVVKHWQMRERTLRKIKKLIT